MNDRGYNYKRLSKHMNAVNHGPALTLFCQLRGEGTVMSKAARSADLSCAVLFWSTIRNSCVFLLHPVASSCMLIAHEEHASRQKAA